MNTNTEVIHLTTSESFIQKSDKKISEQMLNAFHLACSRLDAAIFEPYIHEDTVFQDMDKYRFLQSMKKLFDDVREIAGADFIVTFFNTTCKGCSQGKPVKHYIIKNSNNQKVDSFDYLIDKSNGIVVDIYRCSWAGYL